MAQQVAFLDDGSVTERLNLAANVALSKRIGPAVYLNHSQAGAFGWAFADAHPEWVKGLIQVEPNGPPFRDVSLVKGDPWHAFRPGIARAHGITREPLAWAPPLGAGKLPMTEEGSPDFSGAIRCLVQAEPAHQLPNLAKVPILIVTGEASFRATYDHCTAKFLRQAGVPNTHAQLGHEGIRGNSHMMMLELNNEAIADFMTRWLQRSVK